MLEAAELNWTVSKRPSYTIDTPDWSDNVGLIQAEDTYHIVRDSDNTILSHCGKNYVPFQNERVFEFFKRFTEAGDMTMETAGSLRNGKEIWGLAKISDDFELAGGDKIGGYLLINQPHVAGKSMTIKLTPIRVVCNNTLTLALEQAGNHFRVPHVRDFNDQVVKTAEEALGLSKSKMQEFQQYATTLSKAKAKHSDVIDYVAEIYQPDMLMQYKLEEKLRSEGKAVGIQEPLAEKLNKFPALAMEGYYNSPGSNLKSAKETWWGAFNAVTYVEDHLRTSQVKGNALHSAWFGAGANRKAKALDMALSRAA